MSFSSDGVTFFISGEDEEYTYDLAKDRLHMVEWLTISSVHRPHFFNKLPECVNLKRLHIHRDSPFLQVFFESEFVFTGLQELRLLCNPPSQLWHASLYLVPFLSAHPSLTSLDLSYCGLRSPDLFLLQGAACFSSLTFLSLKGNSDIARGLDVIADALAACSSLRTLDLDDTGLSNSQTSAKVALAAMASRLEALHVHQRASEFDLGAGVAFSSTLKAPSVNLSSKSTLPTLPKGAKLTPSSRCDPAGAASSSGLLGAPLVMKLIDGWGTVEAAAKALDGAPPADWSEVCVNASVKGVPLKQLNSLLVKISRLSNLRKLQLRLRDATPRQLEELPNIFPPYGLARAFRRGGGGLTSLTSLDLDDCNLHGAVGGLWWGFFCNKGLRKLSLRGNGLVGCDEKAMREFIPHVDEFVW